MAIVSTWGHLTWWQKEKAQTIISQDTAWWRRPSVNSWFGKVGEQLKGMNTGSCTREYVHVYNRMVGTLCLYMLLIQKRHSFSMFNAHEIKMYVKPAFLPYIRAGHFPVACT